MWAKFEVGPSKTCVSWCLSLNIALLTCMPSRPQACFRAIMCERHAQETYTGNVHTDTYMFRSFIRTVRTGLIFGQLQNRSGTSWRTFNASFSITIWSNRAQFRSIGSLSFFVMHFQASDFVSSLNSLYRAKWALELTFSNICLKNAFLSSSNSIIFVISISGQWVALKWAFLRQFGCKKQLHILQNAFWGAASILNTHATPKFKSWFTQGL